MPDYKRIFEMKKEGVSQRAIADALACSRNTVSKAFSAAEEKGIVWEEVADLDSSEVRNLLFPEQKRPRRPCTSTVLRAIRSRRIGLTSKYRQLLLPVLTR